MRDVEVVLVVVGAAALVGFVTWALRRGQRVAQAANQFQIASVEAIAAIKETPADEERQFRAIAAWERSRAFTRSLSRGEQISALRLMKDSGFPVTDVGEFIQAFMDAKDAEFAELDEELLQMTQGR